MYRDIENYGLIGDTESLALISIDGSIDYCTMPQMDSATVFAGILDDQKGGYFQICPSEDFQSEQQYIHNTNVLKTTFETEQGTAELIDFMPVFDGKQNSDYHAIRRYLSVKSGEMSFELKLYPRPDYGRSKVNIRYEHNNIITESEKEQFLLRCSRKNINWQSESDGITTSFSIGKNEQASFDFTYDETFAEISIEEDLDRTVRFWREWLKQSIKFDVLELGKYSDMLCRSLLVLKLLTFEPSGAIAAAATTSLPEAIGANRNWDYRFTWLRDASFTLKAFFALGHLREAERFIHFLQNTYRKYGGKNLQIMYSLEGQSEIKEEILEHLQGYKRSSPVRIGNEAYKQNQWDIYGEVMDSALRLSDYAGRIDEDLWPFFRDVCELAIKNYNEPDSGIWEMRTRPQHFVYSKLMCWVALDRGIKIAQRYGFDGPVEKWKDERQKIKELILNKGFNTELNSFVQNFDSKELDASLLLIGLMDFLPVKDKRIQGTIDACQKHLMRDSFVARYTAEDGLEGDEGAFVLCNFWLIELLARSNRFDEAKRLLSNTLKASNHLGLFAEEYDVNSNKLLGNFPQAFSHIGFINAAVSITDLLERRQKRSILKLIIDFLKRKVPAKITLNYIEPEESKVSHNIAADLKKALNKLQGGFFDVQESRVDYQAMKKSQSFDDYLKLAGQLQNFDLSSLQTEQDKKAFWINIYNILIIHAVCHFNLNKSVRQVTNFFGRVGYKIGSDFFSPNDIEHGILRANKPKPSNNKNRFTDSDHRINFSLDQLDYRIHFAIVCAASSCPPIEFYDSDKIDEQLDIAGKSFLNRRGLTFDKKRSIIYLSHIFNWYAEDFGKSKKERLENIVKFANDEDREYILKNLDSLQVKYHPYDWNLNRTLR